MVGLRLEVEELWEEKGGLETRGGGVVVREGGFGRVDDWFERALGGGEGGDTVGAMERKEGEWMFEIS